MKKSKRGISLIVLIVTIIVIIILAAVVILALNNNNPISSAKEAAFKEDVRGFQDELSMSLAREYTSNPNSTPVINATSYEDIKTYIPSFTKKYEGMFEIKNNSLVYVGDEKQNEYTWAQSLNVPTQTAANWDDDIDMTAFIWDSNDQTILKAIDGSKFSGQVKLRIPSKCKKIELDTLTDFYNARVQQTNTIATVELPDGLEEIGPNSFNGYTSLTKINIPDSVTSIGLEAFTLCNNLSDISISDSSNLEYIRGGELGSTKWSQNLPLGEIYLGKVFYKYNGSMPNDYELKIKDGTKTMARWFNI